jgi:hypothetical protein
MMPILQPLTKRDAEQLVDRWLQTLNTLRDQVAQWAREEGWQVTERPTEISEEIIPFSYTAPMLEVSTETGQIVLEPIARVVVLSGGRVDLYAYPTMNRVKLLRDDKRDEWFVLTDSGIEWPHSWSKETFIELVRGLLRRR